MNKFTRILVVIIVVLLGIMWLQHKRTVRISDERDNYKLNTEALLSDVKRLQIDSTTMAIDVNALRLTKNEYKQLRAEDLSKIKKMGVRIKDLESAARHDIEINVPIKIPIIDSIIIRNITSCCASRKDETTDITLDAIVENNEVVGKNIYPYGFNINVIGFSGNS